MSKFFSNLSIYRKILTGFFAVIGLSVVMSLVGTLELRQIRNITQELTPYITEIGYLEELTLALESLDRDIERYTTIGGAENKENINDDLLEMEKNLTLLIRDIIPNNKEEEQVGEEIKLFNDLKENIAGLVALQEENKVQGVNEQIVLVYSSLSAIKDKYKAVRQDLQEEFNSRWKSVV